MAKRVKECQLYSAVGILLLISICRAQRPSFAGSRPLNGLNQKDKYIPTSTQSADADVDVENRFGSVDTANVTNQTQRPPVGYPVVLPDSTYTAVASTSNISVSSMGNSVGFEDRFGETDGNCTTSQFLASTSTTTQRSGVPLDAHGDQLLINYLNQIPVDKRPFWFINYQAIEAQRNATAANVSAAQQSRGSFSG